MRRIKADDIPAIREFWSKTPGLELLPGDDRENLQDFLQRNSGTCFLEERDGKIIGTVLGGYDGRRGYIYHLGVDPLYRGEGLGRALMKRVTDALKKEGAPKIHLYVYRNNIEAIKFYLHLGWKWREELRMMTWEEGR